MNADDRAFPPSYPLGFLARTTALIALACAAGLAILRYVFSRDLGSEYGAAFATLKHLLSLLVPSLIFCALAVLLVASVAVFVVAVFASHKVAGPLFRLQRVAGYLDDRVLVGHIHLRAGDQGKSVARVMNEWGASRKEALRALKEQMHRCELSLRACQESIAAEDRNVLPERMKTLSLALCELEHKYT